MTASGRVDSATVSQAGSMQALLWQQLWLGRRAETTGGSRALHMSRIPVAYVMMLDKSKYKHAQYLLGGGGSEGGNTRGGTSQVE